MKIEVLVENTSENHLKSEHGLSLFITHNKHHYLLDAGSTSLFMENAKKMDVDLNKVEMCFLSHGHYDHSGGFETFLDTYQNVNVFAMDTFDKAYYSGSKGKIHYIGVDENLIKKHDTRFIRIHDLTKINEDVYLLPHSTSHLDKVGEKAKLYLLKETYVADDFSHECSVVFKTDKGLVVFNSCSHAGLKNILEEVKKAFPSEKIYAFIGGLHMKATVEGKEICTFSEDEIKELCTYINNSSLSYVYSGHCTGRVAYQKLKEHLQDTLHLLTTGKMIKL